MRVTYQTISRTTTHIITDRYNDLSKIQEILSTGKRLLRPSDAPTDVSNDLQLRSKLRQYEQYNKNIEDGLGFMNNTDNALASMDETMQRLRELAIQASSDTISASNRKQILSEVNQLTHQMIMLINSSYKGDYIFGGSQTKIMPFPLTGSNATTQQDYDTFKMAYYNATATGVPTQLRDGFTDAAITNLIPGSFKLAVGTTQYLEGTDYTVDYVNGTITLINATLVANVKAPVNYQPGAFKITFEYVGVGKDLYGDPVTHDNNLWREIENAITAPINITSNEVIVNKNTGTNLLKTIIKLGQDLQYNNRAGIAQAIGEIDNSYNTILSAQATNGARINRFELTLQRNEDQITTTTNLHSQLEDADIAEYSTKFSIGQTVYEAALRSAAKILQPSLVNFL